MARKIKKQKKLFSFDGESVFKDYWTKENYWILLTGLVLIVIGFFLMAQSPYDNPISLSVSPVVLVIAYVVVIPFAILYKSKKKKTISEQ